MTTRIIVPHRGLAASKTRLATVLDAGQRETLAADLLGRVLRTLTAACGDVVVISPSEALRPIVEEAEARLEVQRGMGLNEGLNQARDAAIADGVDSLVVVHGDLPNLKFDDVRALIAPLAASPHVAIAPDRAGTGTNGLGLAPPGIIGFSFGAGSFAAHVAASRAADVEATIVRRPGLAFDLDTPDDLARWRELGDVA